MQAGHLCWSMCVQSSLVRFLSNAVAKLPCNYWERTWNISVIKYFRMTLSIKKMVITATEVVLIKLFSYTIVSNQKKKNKMKTQDTMAPSYHSKVFSTQSKGVPFFSCLAHGVWYYISMFLLSLKFFQYF